MDMLNAMQCYVAARCAGNEDVSPSDFQIFKKELEVLAESEPESSASLEDKLKMFTISLGGQVVSRG